jgi:acrylyl-CoA reductase (NADPH)
MFSLKKMYLPKYPMKFTALQINETADGKFERQIVRRDISDLPKGDLLIRVHYSALNYKDGLSANGHKGITRNFPHTPGIEACGVVERSFSPMYHEGDEVFITGYDLGMNTSGAYAEYISVPADWVMPKPAMLDPKDCMTIGTAGFTAAYALHKMEACGQRPEDGPVVVTGATGGVGSLSVAILSKVGYEVIAVTGKPHEAGYLRYLGAASVEPRSFVNDDSGRPLTRSLWAGAIDTVGGNTLTTLVKRCRRDGCIVATGLLSSNHFESAIYPFILNGINLLGIGAGMTPMTLRMKLWQKLLTDWNVCDRLAAIANEVELVDLKDTYLDSIMTGQTKGRVVVNLRNLKEAEVKEISELTSGTRVAYPRIDSAVA